MSPSWGVLKKLFSWKCENDEQLKKKKKKKKKKSNNTGCPGSLCGVSSCQSVVRPEITTAEVSNASSGSSRSPSKYLSGAASSSFSSHSSASVTASATTSSSIGGSSRRMHLRKLSGCYECNVMVDPLYAPCKVPSIRANICPCPDCGELFLRPESLEFHQAVRHAVSELGPEDTSRNIIEIIFQSSWLKNQAPICRIDRILKVHNTHKAITRFEDYRDSIKIKANKHARKNPRCIADGNELLRFYSTTFMCSLGLNGTTNLCQSNKRCNVCSIIRDGFKADEVGKIQTMATSGGAHDMVHATLDDEKRAMLVCRVIAGRVRTGEDGVEEFDSFSGLAGAYPNLEELFVFSPKAILPCFVVIYRSF